MKLTADRLIHAINNSIEGYEASDALKILRTDFGFTDFEILQLGLEYLFHLAEEDEPEEPLEEFTFVYMEEWRGLFTIPAHSREEATNLFEKQLDNDEIGTLDRLEMCNSDWYILN